MSAPRRVDPRWVQVAAIASYAIAARTIFHIERPNWLIFASVGWGMALDFAIGRLKFKTFRFPLSAAIIGLASTVMIDSKWPLVFFAATTVAILSKAFVTYRGKHFINPANFGAVVIFQWAVGYAISTQRIYSGYLLPTLIVFIIGLATVIYARQAVLALSFIAGFIVCALIRMELQGLYFIAALGPVLSPTLLIFTFHMLSDPATTPKTVKDSVAFAFAVAVLDMIFRMRSVPFGTFYALFLVSCLLPAYRALFSRDALPQEAA